MQGQVHLRQRHRVVGLLGAEDRELPGGGLVVTLDELRALDEHAARATGRVEDAALIGLQDLDDQPDDGVGREVLTTALALLGGEVGEEVLVDEAEGVAGELGRERGEEAQQLDQGRALQLLIAARQDVLQLRVGGLDRLDRLVDGLADVVALRQPDQVRTAGTRRGRRAPTWPCSPRSWPGSARSPWPRPRLARPRSGSRRTRGTPDRAPGRGTAPASASSWLAARRQPPTGWSAPSRDQLPSQRKDILRGQTIRAVAATRGDAALEAGPPCSCGSLKGTVRRCSTPQRRLLDRRRHPRGGPDGSLRADRAIRARRVHRRGWP